MRFSAALALGSACCLLGADAQFNKGVRASDFVPAELDMRKMAANFKRNHKQPGQLLPLSLKKYDSYKTNLEAAQHAAVDQWEDSMSADFHSHDVDTKKFDTAVRQDKDETSQLKLYTAAAENDLLKCAALLANLVCKLCSNACRVDSL